MLIAEFVLMPFASKLLLLLAIFVRWYPLSSGNKGHMKARYYIWTKSLKEIYRASLQLGKSAVHKKPPCRGFIDDEKAFDSVETAVVMTSFLDDGIEEIYIRLLEDIHK